jgi:hypothetical protein
VQLITAEGRQNQNSKDTVVATHEQDMPENALPVTPDDISDVVDDENLNFDESHRFKITLPLERSLNKARQTVDTDHLKVFHNLKIYVNLHNPDGHVSQVRYPLIDAETRPRTNIVIAAPGPKSCPHLYFTQPPRRRRSNYPGECRPTGPADPN